LDAEQREAVTTSAQPLRILAGAGSGKTRVLTRRIAYRVATGDADPRRVMALTFTRKAAGELASRLADLGLRERPTAGTFHAVAYAQLRQRWAGADRRPPALLERKGRILATLTGRGGPLGVAELSGEIEWAKSRLVSPARYAAEAERADRRPPAPLEHIGGLYERYEAEKRKRHVVDFDDLLDLCHAALRQDDEFARAQRWRFRHLFVDEFQDVNPLQFELLRAWLGPRNDLCVVGDPNQAIYRWNGADASYLLEFEELFPGAATVALATNYRCTEPIVRAAAAVLTASRDRNPGRPTGAAVPHVSRDGGRPPTLRIDASDIEEAAAVARAVRDRHAPGASWGAQAVLVRTNAQATLLDSALRRAAIPTRLRGATALLDQAAVRDALRGAAGSGEPLTAWLADLEDALHLDSPQGVEQEPDERLEALGELARLGRELATAEPAATASSLPGWLAANVRGENPLHSGDAVDIVTFHASKGLEWSVVHLAGIEEGFVPISRARTAEALAEEQRLLYVAITRARDELIISWARERTFGERTVRRSPSPWLAAAGAAVASPELAPQQRQLERLASTRAALDAPEPAAAAPPADLVASSARALRRWRSRVARGAGVPPAVILGDRAVASLAERRPASHSELVATGALGPISASRYGDELLAVLASVTGAGQG
jgi:DNA helicase-2/ATP-dependent DNA helicase PcrA